MASLSDVISRFQLPGNSVAVDQLTAMGFGRDRSTQALQDTGDLQGAIAALLETPTPSRQRSDVDQLVGMGFSKELSEDALSAASGHLELAIEQLCNGPVEDDRLPETLPETTPLVRPQRSSHRHSASSSSGQVHLSDGQQRLDQSHQGGNRFASASSSQTFAHLTSPSQDLRLTSGGNDLVTPSDHPNKRRKYENQPVAPFALKGNAADAPASNPPKFRDHPLREEQLRSLAWMLKQERRKGTRGGILADQMGFGKTSTTIGLVSIGGKPDMRNVTDFVPCNATLVLSPDHLVDQWVGEVKKFLGASNVQMCKWVKGQAKHSTTRADKFKVLVIRTTQALGACTGAAFLNVDMVIAAYCVQSANRYRIRITEKIDEGLGKTPRELSTLYGFGMAKKLAALRGVVQTWHVEGTIDEHILSASFPVFELFWWNRLVFDEFHESESWAVRVRHMYKTIGANFRWGLSGTPPVGTLASIKDVSDILHYEKRLKTDEDGQLFLDEYVRQNSSNAVDAITIVPHLMMITHTREERILYRQACHDVDIFDLEEGYDEVCLVSRAKLLKRCSHFDLGAEAGNAQEAVLRVDEQKRLRIMKVQEQLRLECVRCLAESVPASVRVELSRAVTEDMHDDTKSFVSKICRAAYLDNPSEQQSEKAFLIHLERYNRNGEIRIEPKVSLKQPIHASEYYEDRQRHAVLHWVVRSRYAHLGNQASFLVDANQWLSGLEMCQCDKMPSPDMASLLFCGCAALIKLLNAAHRSLQFLQQQLQSIKSDGSGEGRTCSICLEDDCPVSSLCILPCAHVFHTACIRQSLAVRQVCPQCRQPLQGRNVSSLQLELKPEKEDYRKPIGPEEALSPLQQAHGTKLNAVAGTLRNIREADPNAKAIVFVQWSDLATRVEEALRAHEIAVLRFHGSSDVLKKFQEDPKSPAVLILSLEKAASGANLTAASHVLFVHPMNADTVATAVAWEKQAIGRVRRIGQRRSEVHVYRFVARDTVEEHISKRHDILGRCL